MRLYPVLKHHTHPCGITAILAHWENWFAASWESSHESFGDQFINLQAADSNEVSKQFQQNAPWQARKTLKKVDMLFSFKHDQEVYKTSKYHQELLADSIFSGNTWHMLVEVIDTCSLYRGPKLATGSAWPTSKCNLYSFDLVT
jgi:hypothetical protein